MDAKSVVAVWANAKHGMTKEKWKAKAEEKPDKFK